MISDRSQVRSAFEEVVSKVAGAGGWFLLRDKDMDADERRELAFHFREISRAHRSPFSVSRDADLAGEVGADGVHLQHAKDVAAARDLLGAKAWIGVSAHSLLDIGAAREAGADYVTFSPIFPSDSKPGYGPALGVSALANASGSGVPVFALGGIDLSRAKTCRSAGAYGVAVMGGIMSAADPGAETAAYLAELNQTDPTA
ncbi:thiamine phosphate synthase [Terrihabitans sp. B22-R8]|uniref:thiamine phosphate synthase n=1 Tax=Terrihabitans sp. B22-R8 TaxID=3425128 RepID=UPI00403C75FB